MRHTVTHYHIVRLVLLGSVKLLVELLRGKKMAGHMGAERVTTQNLEIVKVDAEKISCFD